MLLPLIIAAQLTVSSGGVSVDLPEGITTSNPVTFVPERVISPSVWIAPTAADQAVPAASPSGAMIERGDRVEDQ